MQGAMHFLKSEMRKVRREMEEIQKESMKQMKVEIEKIGSKQKRKQEEGSQGKML